MLRRRKRKYDVVFVDQVSASIPFLHWLTSSQVLFYCHHPDLLLAQRRPGLHQLYRLPLDWLEQVTTGQADRIVVNSAYTAGDRLIRKNPDKIYSMYSNVSGTV